MSVSRPNGLIMMGRNPDMQKIRVTGFSFENRLPWQFEVEKKKFNKLLF